MKWESTQIEMEKTKNLKGDGEKKPLKKQETNTYIKKGKMHGQLPKSWHMKQKKMSNDSE